MALEDLAGNKYIDALVATNPVGATDPRSEGDDHVRGFKNVVKKSLPDITAPLRTNKGALLGNGISTGAGTADAITADFTPDVTLIDGVTVLVRAQGAITVTNPTFNADGVGAKAIVKGNNEALALPNILGSDQELLLRYNLSNDNWVLLNPRVRDTIICTVYLDAGQSIATSTDVKVNFDQEHIKEDSSMHDNATNNSRLNVPTGYTQARLTAHSALDSLATGIRQTEIWKNGSDAWIGRPSDNQLGSSSIIYNAVVVSPWVTVIGGDYFELNLWQNSGAGLGIAGSANGEWTWFSLEVRK